MPLDCGVGLGQPWPAGAVIGPSFPAVLAAAQTGDEQAFALMWRELQPAVLRYLRVAAPTAAEDMAADTWVSVIRGLGRFRGDERAFRARVFTAARHRAVDWHRQAARRRTQPLPVELLAERTPPTTRPPRSWRPSPPGRLRADRRAPPAQAEVLALRILGGIEVAEVTQILGKRPGAVQAVAFRGTRRLAQRLAAARVAGRRITR